MGAFNPLKSNAHILAYVYFGAGEGWQLWEMCREMHDSPSVKIAGGLGVGQDRPIPYLITQKWKFWDCKRRASNQEGNQHPIPGN